MKEDILKGREVFMEFTVIGNYVKVNAMDTASLTEISINGPASTHEDILKQNALKRLEYALKKRGVIG